MQIITAAIIKGGAGKSTTIGALAQAASISGKKVLVIDLDKQANVTAFIGAQPTEQGSYMLLHGGDPAKLIQHTEQGIDVIAASLILAKEQTKPDSGKRLKRAIEPLKKEYDYIFIDTPPEMGELTYNGLLASTGIIVPLEADTSSLKGLYMLADTVKEMKAKNPELSIIGSIITRYEGHSNYNKHLRGEIEANSEREGIPYLMEIRKGTAIKEAQGMKESLYMYKYSKHSHPAQDYMKLYKIIAKGDRKK